MDDSERKKAIELLKEMRNENKADDKKSEETRLSWMYKGPSDLVDREEYLLGKTIDKTFEILNSGANSDVVGRTGEQSNVPKRLLEKSDNNDQVDIAKKILEDPLYAIKQKEMEARKKLLNNPVKLKQLKQLLLERSKQNSHRKSKKKLKKKSEEDLNLLILKKLKKFTNKEKRKALNKLIQSDSSESSSPHSNEKRKKKGRRKKSSDEESDSSTETSCSSDDSEMAQKYKRKKLKHQEKEKKSNSKNSHVEHDRSDIKRKEKFQMKNKKNNSSDSDSSSGSISNDNKRSSKAQSRRDNLKRRPDSKEYKGSHRRSRSGSRGRNDRGKSKYSEKYHSTSRSTNSAKNYGLMMPDGSKPEVRGRYSPVRKYEKNVKTKTKFVPSPIRKPLTEKEREEKLNEMMRDAKQRKEDRERNLADHRKKQDQEDKLKSYDDDFMRRQMSHLTSQGTMSDRIKSNINNIQRSKSSMESSFMRK